MLVRLFLSHCLSGNGLLFGRILSQVCMSAVRDAPARRWCRSTWPGCWRTFSVLHASASMWVPALIVPIHDTFATAPMPGAPQHDEPAVLYLSVVVIPQSTCYICCTYVKHDSLEGHTMAASVCYLDDCHNSRHVINSKWNDFMAALSTTLYAQYDFFLTCS